MEEGSMKIGCDQVKTRPPVFAQILREQGKLTQERLDEALRRQVNERKFLGEVLCETTPLNAADIARALGLQQFLDLG